MEVINEDIFNNFCDEIKNQLSNNMDKGYITDFKDINSIILELEYHKAKLFIAMREKNLLAMKEYIADCTSYLIALGNSYDLYSIPTNSSTSFELNKGNLLIEVDNSKQSRINLK